MASDTWSGAGEAVTSSLCEVSLMKRVAVVITCFNQARFLAEAIESVRNQSRQPDECILVDDGSTDDTAAIASRYDDVNYVFQQNRGLAAARNTGLQRATAEYILFLDSDDIIRPSAIEYCLAAFAANPNAAFVYGGFWAVNEKHVFIDEIVPEPLADHFASLLRGNPIGMHGTVMYDVGILRRANGFDETLPCCEDYDLYLRLARDYSVASYQGIAAEYRRHGDNMTRNAPMMLRTTRAVLSRYACIARTSPEWSVAYAAGHRFWSMYYGWAIVELLFDELGHQQRLENIISLVASGLQHDPRFVLRVI